MSILGFVCRSLEDLVEPLSLLDSSYLTSPRLDLYNVQMITTDVPTFLLRLLRFCLIAADLMEIFYLSKIVKHFDTSLSNSFVLENDVPGSFLVNIQFL